MAIINVASTAALEAALKTAKAGDTIALAAGAYSGVQISWANFNSAVTITSADPSNQAVLVGLKVSQSSGLNFQNLKMTSAGSTDPYYAFRVQFSNNINFDHLNVYGNLSATPEYQMSGFYVSNSSNVAFTNSSFQDFASAIVANNNTNVTIDNNSFEALNKGGVEAGGISGLTIENNNFSDFQTAAGVHGDAVQVYTTSAAPTQNLTITGNLYHRGSGMGAQGIFIQQQPGNAPIQNVTVENNTILGGEWNSVYLSGVAGTVKVENNTAASWAGYDPVKGANTNYAAYVRFDGNDSGITSLTETGNQAQTYIASSGATVAPPQGNTKLGAVTDNGLALLQAWAQSNPAAAALLPADLAALLSGAAQPTSAPAANPTPPASPPASSPTQPTSSTSSSSTTGAQTIVSNPPLSSPTSSAPVANSATPVLIENAAGALDIGKLGSSGQFGFSQVGTVAAGWTFDGSGHFLGNGKTQFLVQNASGAVDLGQIGSNGQATVAQVGTLASAWSFVGSGDFLGDGRDQFLLENANGALEVGEVGANNQTTYTQLGGGSLTSGVAVVGAGDFLGQGKDQILIENTKTGAVSLGVLGSTNKAIYNWIDTLSSGWTIEGVGHFLGGQKEQFLLENKSGAVALGQVGANGKSATFAQIAALGSGWKFVGVGDYAGTGVSSFLIENASGTLATGTVTGGVAKITDVGAVGSGWSFRG